MEKGRITQEGKDALVRQLEALKIERIDVLSRLEIAREFGDLKENAEYQEAKGSLRKIDQEMSDIENILANAIVMNKAFSEGGIVSFGVKVTLENLDTKEKHIYKIVGDAESDITEGLLSEVSPIAVKMMKKKKGESFVLETNRGTKHFKILKIEE
jgi:transcription elongation factor GreA